MVSKTTTATGRLWVGFVIVLALIPWLIVLLSAPRGFDMTDESFYLMSYAHPEDIQATFSMFALAGRPLYALSGGNIVVIRALGIIIWCAVAAAVSWLTLKPLIGQPASGALPGLEKRTHLPLVLLPVAGGVLYYQSWLITPSYNWLTLIGLCLFWAGLLIWKDPDRSRTVNSLGTALIGFAAAFIFWSKATSAVLLPLFPLMVLILYRKHWRRLLSLPALIAGGLGFLVGISIPLWYGTSPQQVISIISSGIEHQQLMKPAAYNGVSAIFIDAAAKLVDLFLLNAYLYSFQRLALWLLPLAVVILIARLPRPHRPPVQVIMRWSRILLTAGFLGNLVAMTYLLSQNAGYWALNVILLSAAYLYTGQFAYHTVRPAPGSSNGRQYALRALVIFSLSVVFTFGTINTYSLQIGMAAYFLLMGLSVMFLAFDQNSINAGLIRVAVPALFVAIIGLTIFGSLAPYRQNEAVWQMQHRVTPGPDSGAVLATEEMAGYITKLQTLADASGFEPGTPIIDLTGETPGAAYILDGRAFGFPWLLGGYPGSDAAAVYLLDHWEPDQLRRAWILTTKSDSKRSLSDSTLAEVGLNFPVDYLQVGIVLQPLTEIEQVLWRPAGD